MKTISTRFFEIQREGSRIPHRFSIHDCEDGSVQVSSIHPYDETDYHWALKSAGRRNWQIILRGRKVSTVGTTLDGTELTPEQIAHFLIQADADANLTPRRAIW